GRRLRRSRASARDAPQLADVAQREPARRGRRRRARRRRASARGGCAHRTAGDGGRRAGLRRGGRGRTPVVGGARRVGGVVGGRRRVGTGEVDAEVRDDRRHLALDRIGQRTGDGEAAEEDEGGDHGGDEV